MAYVSRYAPGQKALIGGGDAPAGDATAATSAQPAPQPPGSGAFTDFSAYLNANKDQASQYAQKLTQPIGAQADAASKLTPPSILDGPGNAVGDTFNLVGNLPGYLQNSAQNAQRADAKKALETGPTPNPGGNYTPGMASLDSFLYGAAGGPQQMDALRQKYSGLLEPQQPNLVPRPTPVVPVDEEAEARRRAYEASQSIQPGGE